MAEGSNPIEQSTDVVAPAATRPEQPPPGEPAGGDTFVRVALIKLAVVVGVGVVTYLGPILKPFLVAVFLYFSTKAAARF